MQTGLYPEFLLLLDDLQKVVTERQFFLWQAGHEPAPESYDLSVRPAIAEKALEVTVDKFACTLCSRRISYKKGQFEPTLPLRPFLFLIHNDFLGPKAEFYNNPEENALFVKMVEGVLGFHPREALVREIVRCHFSKEETGNTDSVQNCTIHLHRDIARGIRGILLFGQAASFVIRDKAKLQELQGKVFPWHGLPTMVVPGPARLIAMREKKLARDQIDAERRRIYEILKTFKEKVIGAA
ncbi:MAG: hypothetical protein N2Z22_11725 [Turneriella sp.]|nr:hypothetical protein [Turneriella sp.]